MKNNNCKYVAPKYHQSIIKINGELVGIRLSEIKANNSKYEIEFYHLEMKNLY